MFEIEQADCIQRLTLKWNGQPVDVLPAWVAETDFSLAPPVAEALHRAVANADVGYPPRDLDSPLSPAWASHLDEVYGWMARPEQVYALPGVVLGLYAAVQAFSAPGEQVVVTPPIYAPFADAIDEQGRRRVDVPLIRAGKDEAFRLDLDGLHAAFAAGARLMLLCHPHNPTGTVFPRETLAELGRLADAHGVVVVSDEVHAPMPRADVEVIPYAVAVDHPERTVGMVSMSKAFSFAGLKCGAAVVGDAVAPGWTAVPRRLRSGPGLLGVLATMAALGNEGQAWLAAMRDHLDEQVDRLATELPDVLPGTRVHRPDAGYLVWVDLRATAIADDAAARMLAAGVRVADGDSFGNGGAGHVRVNVATSTSILTRIIDRMGAAA